MAWNGSNGTLSIEPFLVVDYLSFSAFVLFGVVGMVMNGMVLLITFYFLKFGEVFNLILTYLCAADFVASFLNVIHPLAILYRENNPWFCFLIGSFQLPLIVLSSILPTIMSLTRYILVCKSSSTSNRFVTVTVSHLCCIAGYLYCFLGTSPYPLTLSIGYERHLGFCTFNVMSNQSLQSVVSMYAFVVWVSSLSICYFCVRKVTRHLDKARQNTETVGTSTALSRSSREIIRVVKWTAMAPVVCQIPVWLYGGYLVVYAGNHGRLGTISLLLGRGVAVIYFLQLVVDPIVTIIALKPYREIVKKWLNRNAVVPIQGAGPK